MKKIVYILLLLSLMGCGLKRSNPLDPIANDDILVPEQVSEVTASPSPAGVANKYVRLSWRANSTATTDGYFIYRSLSYYSAFARVDTVFSINQYDHIDILPGDYYYRISGFKQYPSAKLEGRLSAPIFVRVPN